MIAQSEAMTPSTADAIQSIREYAAQLMSLSDGDTAFMDLYDLDSRLQSFYDTERRDRSERQVSEENDLTSLSDAETSENYENGDIVLVNVLVPQATTEEQVSVPLSAREWIDVEDLPAQDQEIDLTRLSSGSECEEVDATLNDLEIVDDLEVQVLDLHNSDAVESLNRRKRRRSNMADKDSVVSCNPASHTFDTRSAESTSISMDNAELVQRFQKSLKCSVCLDYIKQMTSTICGHVYCRKCIVTAIRSSKKCPLCQRKLALNNIHGLYF